MRSCGFILLATLSLALLAGCGPKPPPIVGSWYDPQNEYVVIFSDDHQFKGSEGPITLTGFWTWDGHKATISGFAIGGKSGQQIFNEQVNAMVGSGHEKEIAQLKKSMTPDFELSSDGKTLAYFNEISRKPGKLSRLAIKD